MKRKRTDDGRVSTFSVDAVTVATVAYDAVTADASGVTHVATGAGSLTLGGFSRTAAGAVDDRWVSDAV